MYSYYWFHFLNQLSLFYFVIFVLDIIFKQRHQKNISFSIKEGRGENCFSKVCTKSFYINFLFTVLSGGEILPEQRDHNIFVNNFVIQSKYII